MDDDLVRRLEVQRGNDAMRILEEPLLVEAFNVIKQRYMDEWEKSPARDIEGREKLWLMLKQLENVRNHLKTAMETGKLASKYLEQKRTLAQRMKESVTGLGWDGML
jgi:ribosomal protein S15P/S13E